VRKSGIAVALAGALLLAACGSSVEPPSVSKTTVPVDRKLVLASVDATTAAKTARIDVQTEMSGVDEGTTTMRGDGVIDFETGDSRLTMYIDGISALGMDDGVEIRTVDGVVYTRMPGLFADLPGFTGDKSWMSFDATGRPVGGALFDMTGQSDPTKTLAYLQKISSDVREVGTEDVRGVETTHYHATIDFSKTIPEAEVPEGMRDEVKEFTGMFGSIPADVWIDGDGRMRRERITIDFGKVFEDMPGASEADAGFTMTQTLDLYDFGAAVEVEAPPADQVQTFDPGDLASGFEQKQAA
jgi:hypothetical protein